MVVFQPFPKIPRGQNELITVTEKIDGTNACVVVDNDGLVIGCQSRNRVITPEDDNYGFAKWVKLHNESLASLGPGYHYGEWAGPGIQSNPLGLENKKFFLFNSERWRDGRADRPECCDVVPVIYEWERLNGAFPEYDAIKFAMEKLKSERDYEPEGVVVWYHKTRRYEKHTFKNTEGKWQST